MKQSKKIRRVAAVLAAVAVLCSSTTSLRCADAAVSEGDLDALQQEQQELEQQIPHHGGALGLDDALQLGA